MFLQNFLEKKFFFNVSRPVFQKLAKKLVLIGKVFFSDYENFKIYLFIYCYQYDRIWWIMGLTQWKKKQKSFFFSSFISSYHFRSTKKSENLPDFDLFWPILPKFSVFLRPWTHFFPVSRLSSYTIIVPFDSILADVFFLKHWKSVVCLWLLNRKFLLWIGK